MARERIPEKISARINELRASIESGATGLRASDHEDLLAQPVLDGWLHRMRFQLDRLERRYGAAVARADSGLRHDIESAAAQLYPGGMRQERAHSFIPFLARYGPELVDGMVREAAMHAETLVSERVADRPAAAMPAG
jgi:uncharacterized protein YllA (UPF0747 family)